MQEGIASCTICPSLRPWRQFAPDAYGNPSTGYLLVGEAPGYMSWNKGRRFTGPAGMLIRRALWKVGHPRYFDLEDLFYMTDVVKCHPLSSTNSASNRSPKRAEIEACFHHLVKELNVLKPSLIVMFGKVAAGYVKRALQVVGGVQPEIIAFPHPSPRNQLAILKRYPSLQVFEGEIALTFRRLVAKLEDRLPDA